MTSTLATKIDFETHHQRSIVSIDKSYTGPIQPDDLRVVLPRKVSELEAKEQIIVNALCFCQCLPIVKVPDSVYVDDGDVVFYWKTEDKGSVLVVIDDSYLHYFIRDKDGQDTHKSNVEIDVNAGYLLRGFLPPHPSKSSHAPLRTNNR